MLERFKKYGTIESSKILASKREGYVTFECDRHACLAYNLEKDRCDETRVRVDSTWHQPDEAINIDSEWNDHDDESLDLHHFFSIDEPIDSVDLTLLRLNDDSLYSLFDHCDHLTLVNLSQTCHRLEQLLKRGTYCFPNHKTFRFRASSRLSLVDVGKLFRLMGRYVDALDLWVHRMDGEEVSGYIKTIVKYCPAGNIQAMTFATDWWNSKHFTELHPILEHLTTLQLSIHDFDLDMNWVDFTELCPRLKRLALSDIFLIEYCFTQTVRTLESFHWKNRGDELMDERESFKFFEMNRQLKEFKCSSFMFEDRQRATDLMPNIDTLTVCTPHYSNLSTEDILNLKSFKNLQRLTLGLGDMHWINRGEIIESCRRLKNLVELQLIFPKPEQNHVPIDVSKTLCHLKRLDLYGVPLTEKIVANFVRIATKVNVVHFHECNVYATESLLLLLEYTALSSQQYENALRALSLFIGNERRNNFVGISNRQMRCIECICKHRYTPSYD